ncbi:MAG TPA: hypothetical protein VFS20_21560 [Longimicrobium sp.]|nr:hypothetical protein [Longimicrobium sp.]
MKIRLQPETLVVESFAPSETASAFANSVILTNTCTPNSDFPTQCDTDCDCSLGCPSIAPCDTGPF